MAVRCRMKTPPWAPSGSRMIYCPSNRRIQLFDGISTQQSDAQSHPAIETPAANSAGPEIHITALAGPPSSRTQYVARACSFIAARRRGRIARDQALSVASTVAVAFRLLRSACTVGRSQATGRIRGPLGCALLNQRPAFVIEATAAALHVFPGRRRRPVTPPSAIRRHMWEIAKDRTAEREQRITLMMAPTIVVVIINTKTTPSRAIDVSRLALRG